jgi:mycothiol system anti-sigma-R factor
MISCSEAVRRLWEYLDDNLSEVDRKAVEEHLSLCRRCCGELEFAEELRRFLQSSAREQIPADVRARLHKTLGELET